MDTAEPLAHPQTPLTETTPPWLEDDGIAPAARPVRAAIVRDLHQTEGLHWSVVALTLFTAACVLLSARGGEVSHPRELLPVMITVTP